MTESHAEPPIEMQTKRPTQAIKHCTGHVLARKLDFNTMAEQLSNACRISRFRGVIQVDLAIGEAFIFDFGVVVFWGADIDTEKRLLESISPFLIDVIEPPITDDFTFSCEADPQQLIRSDHISLGSDDSMGKLAISHGIAQSLKLAELEQYAEQTIENSSHIPRNMAESGSTRLGRKAIARMRGRLFLVESDILLHHALLDTPEFFWEYPELEEQYNRTAIYLDVRPRVEVLNKKLQIIHDMFDMLADEQKHQHSSLLEWIIIWLIAIEILIFFLHDYFKII